MKPSFHLVTRARHLRRNATFEERLLWRLVRDKRLGFKFRRQHPFPPYVLDFYCPAAKVAVELDGEHHDPARDARRDAFLLARGILVMRFENCEVRSDPERVAAAIQSVVAARIPLARDQSEP